MPKKVANLSGPDLDRWVAHAHGMMLYHEDWQPSRNWSQAGQFIDDNKIDISYDHQAKAWDAAIYTWDESMGDEVGAYMAVASAEGTTPLEAAMRCYVVSRLGEEVSDEG